MDGKAMFTTVASSEAIPEPSTVTASTQRPGAEETRKEGTATAVMSSDADGRSELSSHDTGDCQPADSTGRIILTVRRPAPELPPGPCTVPPYLPAPREASEPAGASR